MVEIHEMIESARDKVRGFLKLIDADFEEYDTGMFTIEEGSAVIGITLRPWHDGDVVVEFTSQLVSGAELDADRMRWLLETNADMHFGGFGLLFDGTVIYSYAVPAGLLDSETFGAVARTVAALADHYDDEVVDVAGGETGVAATVEG